MRWAEAALGVVILAVAFYDVFQSVVLPRPSIGKLRIAPWILRPLWASWRWFGMRESRIDRRENRWYDLILESTIAEHRLEGTIGNLAARERGERRLELGETWRPVRDDLHRAIQSRLPTHARGDEGGDAGARTAATDDVDR